MRKTMCYRLCFWLMLLMLLPGAPRASESVASAPFAKASVQVPNVAPPAVIVNVGGTQPAAAPRTTSGEGESHAANWEWLTASGTIALAVITALLAIFTGGMWWATLRLAKDAKDTSKRQAVEMTQSLDTAKRSAEAMERVATVTKENADLMQAVMRKQMRAYIVVNTGGGTYQDANLRFAAAPVIENTGFTPAKNVSFNITADVLPAQLPNDYEFRSYGVQVPNDATLGPRQQFVINGVVAHRLPDEEVKTMLKGEGRCLYVWGSVDYEDVFGSKWQTHFCQIYTFFSKTDGSDVQVQSRYHRLHNSST